MHNQLNSSKIIRSKRGAVADYKARVKERQEAERLAKQNREENLKKFYGQRRNLVEPEVEDTQLEEPNLSEGHKTEDIDNTDQGIDQGNQDPNQDPDDMIIYSFHEGSPPKTLKLSCPFQNLAWSGTNHKYIKHSNHPKFGSNDNGQTLVNQLEIDPTYQDTYTCINLDDPSNQQTYQVRIILKDEADMTVILVVLIFVILVCLVLFLIYWFCYKRRKSIRRQNSNEGKFDTHDGYKSMSRGTVDKRGQPGPGYGQGQVQGQNYYDQQHPLNMQNQQRQPNYDSLHGGEVAIKVNHHQSPNHNQNYQNSIHNSNQGTIKSIESVQPADNLILQNHINHNNKVRDSYKNSIKGPVRKSIIAQIYVCPFFS